MALASRATMPPRTLDRAALIETALLAGTGAVFLLKAWQGILAYYIHPRYAPLVVGGGIVLLLLAVVRALGLRGGAAASARRGWLGYALLALPLLLGIAVPAKPLGADALPSAPTAMTQPGQGGIALDGEPRDWNLLQWGTALSIAGEDRTGAAVDLIGFVYHDPARPLGGFIVARYAIICCIADVKGIGVPVIWADGAALPANSWVRVRGTLGTTTIVGHTTPAFIAEAVEPVPQPDEPYLYR